IYANRVSRPMLPGDLALSLVVDLDELGRDGQDVAQVIPLGAARQAAARLEEHVSAAVVPLAVGAVRGVESGLPDLCQRQASLSPCAADLARQALDQRPVAALVDRLAHVERLGKPTAVQPCDAVADLEPGVLDPGCETVPRAGTAEREHVTTR